MMIWMKKNRCALRSTCLTNRAHSRPACIKGGENMEKMMVKTLEEEGMEEEDIYTREARLHLVEDGEISAEEDGFMQGYDEAF